LSDYFDGSPELERALEDKGKFDLLNLVQDITMDSGEIVYVRQRKPRGLGDAVRCAAKLIGDEPFAVLLPDDVIAAEKPCLRQMIDAYENTGGNMVAVMEVPPEKASDYGLIKVREDMGNLLSVGGMVEKPRPEDAPSNLAVIGRYILTPNILTNLATTGRGAGGEIQLTDAIATEIKAHDNVYGFRFDGTRFDCGSKSGFLQATVAFGLAREELRDEFMDYLSNTLGVRHAAQ